ncbi:MAG: pyridoxamine 5'-phosphate oxidase family protein [Chloroflexi bacterium]|nr:pyridoxamine 5'-phosphate oxidase family protein [Chloroflexota bacterium]MDA1145214.1 pyridoxamine 5'-phosphate oxidase family protein [Chloroflexota bacterium]
MVAELTTEEAHAFLDSRPGWIILTTFDRNGYPHTVPIGYFRVGDEVFIGCRDATQKIRNIERNPKVSLLIESGSTMADLKGLMLQGDADVVRDDAERLRLAREGAKQRGMPEADWPTEVRSSSVYIRVRPLRMVSWDNAKAAT